MGTRFGCGLEQCGCCMVLIDGAPEKSCAKPVSSVAGKIGHHHRGAGHAGTPAPAAAGLHRRAGRPVRLLPVRHPGRRRRRCSTRTRRRRAARSRRRSTAISAAAARTTASCAPSRRRPPRCAREPRDERAASRPARRQSRARPLGRLPRAGQGHRAHRPRRARPGRADRDAADRGRRARSCRSSASPSAPATPIKTPNEGYTAGSQSIQFGGVAMRQACADVRALFLDPGGEGARLQSGRAVGPRRQHSAQRRARPGRITGRWPARSI